MSELVQNSLALLLVASAVAYLLWTATRWWRRKNSGDCGGCHGCAKSGNAPTSLVSLEAKPTGPAKPER